MKTDDEGLLERLVPDRFEFFNLSIERIDGIYKARVTGSPKGPTSAVQIDSSLLVFDPPSGAGFEPTGAAASQPVDREDLRRRGERLFQAVFVGPVADKFRASVARVRAQGAGLQVRLQTDAAPELASLPWEALWDPIDGAFLSDQPDLPVARALEVTTETPALEPEMPPLCLLALLPEPGSGSDHSGDAKWRQIEEELAPLVGQGMMEADRLEPPTLEALGRIDDVPCDVLHVVARGDPGEPRSGGHLKLVGASGGLGLVTGDDLAGALERRPPPRLVVLNIYQGDGAPTEGTFEGMAQQLLNRGVPAVVTMRASISDAAAVSFAGALYRALAKGRSIEAAIVEARRKLSFGEHRTEWSAPVLYLRRIVDSESAVIRLLRARGWLGRAVSASAAVFGPEKS